MKFHIKHTFSFSYDFLTNESNKNLFVLLLLLCIFTHFTSKYSAASNMAKQAFKGGDPHLHGSSMPIKSCICGTNVKHTGGTCSGIPNVNENLLCLAKFNTSAN